MDKATEYLVGQGVLGAICVVLLVAVWRLYAELQALHAMWRTFAERQIELLATAKAKTETVVAEYEEILKGRRR
jgi:hypothetical protein